MKRPPSREASCTGKSPLSHQDAKRVARRVREKGERVVPYLCLFCSHWHVGGTARSEGQRGRPKVPLED